LKEFKWSKIIKKNVAAAAQLIIAMAIDGRASCNQMAAAAAA
jgi:hypothetical protein